MCLTNYTLTLHNNHQDDAWILLTSVTPNESNSPSIIDTMTTERKVIESSTQSLINENLTEPITDPSELVKLEETTLEIGSEENFIHISQEENSSETSSVEVGVSEEDEEEESEEETTLETKPIDTDSDEDITTVQNGKKITNFQCLVLEANFRLVEEYFCVNGFEFLRLLPFSIYFLGFQIKCLVMVVKQDEASCIIDVRIIKKF